MSSIHCGKRCSRASLKAAPQECSKSIKAKLVMQPSKFNINIIMVLVHYTVKLSIAAQFVLCEVEMNKYGMAPTW